MQKLISRLKKKKPAQGEKLEAEALIVAQKLLVNMGLDFIPPSYADFLKHYNGVKTEGCYLFGATINDELDIVDQNKRMQKPVKTLLIGYNDFDLLVYHYEYKAYQIIDREDFSVLDSYGCEELKEAIGQILNV